MTDSDSDTVHRLLAAIRQHTGYANLAWATPPTPLAGGFWAEMYVVELVNAPASLAGRLVARVMPDPMTAMYETAFQRHLHRCGLSVPAVRAAGAPGEHLDRAWTLMDLAPGQPLLSGLSAAGAIRKLPTLLRQLPDVLAAAAVALHRCPVDGLEDELSGCPRRPDIDDYLRNLGSLATAVGRRDLADIAADLTSRTPSTRVVCHGDLHPFNLLVDGNDWTLIDWSAAAVADPHFDLAFTMLMLSNPPLGGPAPVRAVARTVGSRLARRFLSRYEQLSGSTVDAGRLTWGRQVHALRALIETESWEVGGTTEAHRGHPWLALRDMFEAELAS